MSCISCASCNYIVDTDMYDVEINLNGEIICQGCFEELIEDLIFDGEINDVEDYEEYRARC